VDLWNFEMEENAECRQLPGDNEEDHEELKSG